MRTLTFRAATTDDIPALFALVTSPYRGDASRIGCTSEVDLSDGEWGASFIQRTVIEVPEKTLTPEVRHPKPEAATRGARLAATQ